HRAFGCAHGLLEQRCQWPAGAAPRRPEIDQHRNLARGVDHIAHEILGGRVLNEVGVGLAAVRKDRGFHVILTLGLGTLYRPPAKAKMAAHPYFGTARMGSHTVVWRTSDGARRGPAPAAHDRRRQ